MTSRVLGASLPAPALLSVRLVAALSPTSPRVVVATLRFMSWSKEAPTIFISICHYSANAACVGKNLA